MPVQLYSSLISFSVVLRTSMVDFRHSDTETKTKKRQIPASDSVLAPLMSAVLNCSWKRAVKRVCCYYFTFFFPSNVTLSQKK